MGLSHPTMVPPGPHSRGSAEVEGRPGQRRIFTSTAPGSRGSRPHTRREGCGCAVVEGVQDPSILMRFVVEPALVAGTVTAAEIAVSGVVDAVGKSAVISVGVAKSPSGLARTKAEPFQRHRSARSVSQMCMPPLRASPTRRAG